MKLQMVEVVVILLLANGLTSVQSRSAYTIVDTGQNTCYDDSQEIAPPEPVDPFYGQDAQYAGPQPSYTISGDGLTVYDNNTDLTWIRAPDTDGDGDVDSDDKLAWTEIQAYPDTLNAQNFGGHNDWRLPTIKELYSLIDFRGIDPSGYSGNISDLVPFIDTDYFAFAYGDESAGERIIDAQYWSSTEYVGITMGGDSTVFGVNFADGRIKGYPRDTGPSGDSFTEFILCVRGNTVYGVNSFVENGDGTVTDQATGLMWMQDDSEVGLNWEDALNYAVNLGFAGHGDWRLPNAKELQSIVDYTRSPSTSNSAAIDPTFSCTSIIDEGGETNYPFYWTATTHANWTESPGAFGVYVTFGEALGYMEMPPGSGNYQLVDVHGAGAQRSDPKSGDPDDYPYGHGPQGDVVRIYNFVRCVREEVVDDDGDDPSGRPSDYGLLKCHPNPFRAHTTITFLLPETSDVILSICDLLGRRITTLAEGHLPAGVHEFEWQADVNPSGMYFCRLCTGRFTDIDEVIIKR